MSEGAIGQRLKVLIGDLGLDVRGFCKVMDVSETTVRNYFNRGSNPNAEFLTKLSNSFEQINLGWLLSGRGEVFLPGSVPATSNTANINNNSGIGINTGTATQHITLEACQRELEAVKRDAASYQREIRLLEGQLKDKEEIITLLRGGYNRPN
jgi:transcriptional regulator with XRE-family HTH domain